MSKIAEAGDWVVAEPARVRFPVLGVEYLLRPFRFLQVAAIPGEQLLIGQFVGRGVGGAHVGVRSRVSEALLYDK